jgi:hypothetical protein
MIRETYLIHDSPGQQQVSFAIGDDVIQTVLPGYGSFDLDWLVI